MQQIKELLDARKQYLEQLIKEKKQNLIKAPGGHLRICAGGNKTQYYHRTETNDFSGVYIKAKDIKLAKELAQKDYDLQVINACKKELEAIKKYETSCPDKIAESIYQALHPARQSIVTPICETDEAYIQKWESVEYSGKEFSEDAPELYTLRGERVRSKSEMLIADMLSQEGIPYRYEYPLYMKGFGKVYPDFTILNINTRKEVLWEHFGMMDDPEYVEKAIKKIAMYERQGIFLGEGLVVTFESKNLPLNSKMVDCTIKHYLI